MSILVRHRYIFLSLWLLMVLASFPFLEKAMLPNNAINVWFLDDDPLLKEYNQFHKTFGNDEVIVIGFGDQSGIVNEKNIKKTRELTAALEKIDGISRVYSLSNVKDFFNQDGALSVEPLVPDEIPASKEFYAKLKEKFLSSSLIRKRLINEKADYSLLIAQMDVMGDIDLKRDGIVLKTYEICDKVLGKGVSALGGVGVIYSGLNLITQHDFGLFIGLCYILMFAVIYFLFGSFKLVFLSLGVVFSATIVTLGIYGATGHQVNMVTVMLPTLIIVLGMADILHVLNEHGALLEKEELSLALVEKGLAKVFKPCFYTTITTGAGFLALTSAKMAVLKEFGMFSAIGIVFALISSFVMCAAFLAKIDMKKKNVELFAGLSNRMIGLSEALKRSPTKFWTISFVLILFFIFGARGIVIDTFTLGYLPDDHKVVKDHELMNKSWGAYASLEMTIDPKGELDLKSPEIIKALNSFEKDVLGIPDITNFFAINTILERVALILEGPDLLKSRQGIAQAILMVESDPDNELYRVADDDFKKGRITLTGPVASAQSLDLVFRDIEKIAEVHFKDLAGFQLTGYPPLYVKIIDYVMDAQISSFYIAVSLIFTLMLFMLRSLKMAFLSLIPNLFPVLMLMGVMGYLGVDLDIATATVTAIVLGVAIDDTIHFLVNYQEELENHSHDEAINRTFAKVGRAIFLTSMILFIGYLVLLFASVKTVFYFGLLTALAVIAAFYGDLVILPLVLNKFSPKK